jgi:secreted PhoX family phosphatase
MEVTMLRHAPEDPGNTAAQRERPFDDEGVHSNPVLDERATFQQIVEARLSRRGFLKGVSVLTIGAGAASLGGSPAFANSSSLTFRELPHGNDEGFHVAEGYDHTVLIRWGDPVEGGAPSFDPMHQTVDAQLKQFGYNNDFIGYFPLPAGSKNSDHGLLVINHEYTNTDLMFPGLPEKDFNAALTREQVDIEMAAQPGDRHRLRDLDQQHQSLQGQGRRPQSARQQQARPYRRTGAAGQRCRRRPRRPQVPLEHLAARGQS